MSIDCEFTGNLVCPYCGHEHEDDGEMNTDGEHQCYDCEKKFKYEVEYSKTFCSRQVACLNGAPHEDKEYPYSEKKKAFCCKACGRWRYEDIP